MKSLGCWNCRPSGHSQLRLSARGVLLSIVYLVVEMNMGQILHEVKKAVDDPNKVFLANQIDGSFIAPTDILNVLRVLQGRGI